jgi:hypothetical protein
MVMLIARIRSLSVPGAPGEMWSNVKFEFNRMVARALTRVDYAARHPSQRAPNPAWVDSAMSTVGKDVIDTHLDWMRPLLIAWTEHDTKKDNFSSMLERNRAYPRPPPSLRTMLAPYLHVPLVLPDGAHRVEDGRTYPSAFRVDVEADAKCSDVGGHGPSSMAQPPRVDTSVAQRVQADDSMQTEPSATPWPFQLPPSASDLYPASAIQYAPRTDIQRSPEHAARVGMFSAVPVPPAALRDTAACDDDSVDT